MRTFSPKPSDIERAWHVIDADGAVLGRLATEVATLLRGKHKPTWAPHVDAGDHVIVVNAAKLDVGPRKAEGKTYWRHSGYPGGIKSESLGRLLERDPEKVVRQAVKGMVPKGRLGRQTLKKLRVYADPPTHMRRRSRSAIRCRAVRGGDRPPVTLACAPRTSECRPRDRSFGVHPNLYRGRRRDVLLCSPQITNRCNADLSKMKH